MKRIDPIWSTLLAALIGVIGAVALAHWAACSEVEVFCLVRP